MMDQWIISLLKQACEQGASDVHLGAGRVPVFRVCGRLRTVAHAPRVGAASLDILIQTVLEDQNTASDEEDFALSVSGVGRFRCHTFKTEQGRSIAFRVLPDTIASLDALGLHPGCKQCCGFKHGLVLVAGSTGSGKSTTLAAMIAHINATQARHIVTLEDPIEYLHASQQSLVQQRQVGRDTDNFTSGLRAALREDPDVIVVGELRDVESTRLALHAAETGHLVFSTVHANSCVQVLSRILASFSAQDQAFVQEVLASTLQMVISQRLVTHQNKRCVAQEVMVLNNAIRHLIRDNQLHQITSVMQTGRQHGMQTMAQALAVFK
jgi:twitching motility protein PilT